MCVSLKIPKTYRLLLLQVSFVGSRQLLAIDFADPSQGELVVLRQGGQETLLPLFVLDFHCGFALPELVFSLLLRQQVHFLLEQSDFLLEAVAELKKNVSN